MEVKGGGGSVVDPPIEKRLVEYYDAMPYAQKVCRLLRYALTGTLVVIESLAQPRPDENLSSLQRGHVGEVKLRLRHGDSMRSRVGGIAGFPQGMVRDWKKAVKKFTRQVRGK